MERKLHENKRGLSTILIAGIIIAIIVIVGAGAYVFSTQNSNPLASPSPTTPPQGTSPPTEAPTATASNTAPTATAASTPSATPTASATAKPNVAGASSLQYSISATENGVSQGSYTYSGKNIGTNNFMLRIEFTDTDGSQTIYIVNGQLQKSWSYSDGEWNDLSAAYQMQYTTWNQAWQGYVTSLQAWSGLGDYSYTQGGTTVRIYNINVNPSLADSLFTHS